jgi:hypothetical protein
MISSGAAGQMAPKKESDSKSVARDRAALFEMLKTRPYVKIASELRKITFIEALVLNRVSVQDKAGKLHGAPAYRAEVQFKFTADDAPLVRVEGERKPAQRAP